jgi:uncharacterized phage protein gp47/JayE
MPFEPREQESIYESLRDSITGKIPDLTNFTDTSFNWVWSQGFAAQFREQELDKTATYLSGLIDYSGGPVTEEDLEELGIDNLVTAEEINERLDDEDLDELVKIVGVSRDPGSRAIGTVTFTTQNAATTIPEGTSIGTQPEEDGSFLEFTTDEEVTNGSGETTVDADITASEVGSEYNIGATSITYLPNPPTGVQSVTNAQETTGGEDEESNDELRERAKNSIFASSGGGTVEGVKGYINQNVDNVDEVEITEFFTGDAWHGSYPHAHVIVSGGTESDIEQAISESRPVAVQHVLVRPDSFPVRVDLELSGTDINNNRVINVVQEYINGLGLDDTVTRAKIIQRVMNADADIEDIESLELYIENETIFYDSSTDVYDLYRGNIMSDDGISEVTGTLNGNSHTFVEDTDYQEWNTSAGNTTTPHDAIDWSLGGDDPDVNTGSTQTIEYVSGTDEYLVDDALITDGITNVEGTLNGSSHTFTEGTDYEEVDVRADGVINGIDWAQGGDTPDDETEFTVTYDEGTSFNVTYLLQDGQDVDFENETQPIAGTVNVTIA